MLFELEPDEPSSSFSPAGPSALPEKENDPPLHELGDRKHLLIVDDSDIVFESIRALLARRQDEELVVERARDGIGALKQIEARHAAGAVPYHIIFMDLDMPNMRGDDATLELRKRESSGRRSRCVFTITPAHTPPTPHLTPIVHTPDHHSTAVGHGSLA